jgi:hypothetical protein
MTGGLRSESASAFILRLKVESIPKKRISIIDPKIVIINNGENISSALKSKIV